MAIKVMYTTRRGACVMRNVPNYKELGKVIYKLYQARIIARAEDDMGECGAVFRHPDDNKLCWYYYRGGDDLETNAPIEIAE